MKRRHTGMPAPVNCASSNRAYLIVAGLIVAGLIVAGLIVAGLIVAGLIVAGLIVAGLIVAGFIFVRLIIAVNPRLSNISKVNRRGEPALV